MKPRKLALGDRNIIGARVTQARKQVGMKQVELLARLQTKGVDISIATLFARILPNARPGLLRGGFAQ